MTTTQPTIDARLAPVLAEISAHGIAVRRTLDPSPAGTHAAMIRAELAARFPAGLGSYVLWATSGDAYALHCSDARSPTPPPSPAAPPASPPRAPGRS